MCILQPVHALTIAEISYKFYRVKNWLYKWLRQKLGVIAVFQGIAVRLLLHETMCLLKNIQMMFDVSENMSRLKFTCLKYLKLLKFAEECLGCLRSLKTEKKFMKY